MKDLQSRMTTAEGAISDLQDAVTTINQYLGILGKRLTSLVYAPTTYVDGIEATTFTTMSYMAWSDLTDSAIATDGKVYTIDNTLNNIVENLVRPKHIEPKNIYSLSLNCDKVKNINTRAASTQAPIEVDEWT